MPGRSEPGVSGMSFWGHLEALRWTLFRMLAVFFCGAVAAFVAMPRIFDRFILGPVSSDFFLYRLLARIGDRFPFMPDFCSREFHVDIININVSSQFMTHISTSFYLAVVLVFPYLLYELWKFIRPALYDNEMRHVRLAFICGTLMFYAGCAVGYCLVFPFTFRFLAEYQLSVSIVNQINLSSYIGIFLMMIFVMGLVFELPVLAWVLSRMGIVNRALLVKGRRYAVVGLLVLSAIITPSGDPFTLAVVFVPLYLLYELSVCVVRD